MFAKDSLYKLFFSLITIILYLTQLLLKILIFIPSWLAAFLYELAMWSCPHTFGAKWVRNHSCNWGGFPNHWALYSVQKCNCCGDQIDSKVFCASCHSVVSIKDAKSDFSETDYLCQSCAAINNDIGILAHIRKEKQKSCTHQNRTWGMDPDNEDEAWKLKIPLTENSLECHCFCVDCRALVSINPDCFDCGEFFQRDLPKGEIPENFFDDYSGTMHCCDNCIEKKRRSFESEDEEKEE